MKVIGIDPGIERLGYGISENKTNIYTCIDVGCFFTSAKNSHSNRLLDLHTRLTDLIRLHRPDGAVVEKLFFSKNIRTAMTIAEARGMILLTLEKENVPFVELSPQHVKMGVTGNGAASKSQVQRMVQVLYNLKALPKPDDAADALALAFAGSSHFRHHNTK